VSRSDTPLPTRLRVVGATDLERRVLNAAARELPSVELTEKMQKALGISLAAGALAAAAKATTATAKASSAAAPAFAWPAISVGVLALAMTGAVVGLHSNASHHAASKPAAAVIAPATAAAPTLATAAAAPSAATPVAAAPVAAATVPVLVARAAERPAVAALAVRARHRHAAVTSSSDLRAEIALVDAARTAIATGADDRALALLQRYDGSFPRGTFRPEATALRIEALDHLGRAAQARTLASKFIAAHADSPLADRVARLTGVPAR
jgi:hypothetical protein